MLWCAAIKQKAEMQNCNCLLKFIVAMLLFLFEHTRRLKPYIFSKTNDNTQPDVYVDDVYVDVSQPRQSDLVYVLNLSHSSC